MKLMYISMITVLFLVSCAGEEDSESTIENSDETTTETIEESDVIPEDIMADLEGLTLNDGEKWEVDISTGQGMNEVQLLLDNYDGTDSKQLGKDIKGMLKEVINDCDFEGEDHNQYHIILHAMLSEAKALKKGDSEDVSKMQGYINAYNQYFDIGELE